MDELGLGHWKLTRLHLACLRRTTFGAADQWGAREVLVLMLLFCFLQTIGMTVNSMQCASFNTLFPSLYHSRVVPAQVDVYNFRDLFFCHDRPTYPSRYMAFKITFFSPECISSKSLASSPQASPSPPLPPQVAAAQSSQLMSAPHSRRTQPTTNSRIV